MVLNTLRERFTRSRHVVKEEGFLMESQTLQRAEIAAAASTLWKIDPVNSAISFSVKHMVVATVHGRFDGFRGTIRFDGNDPYEAVVDVEIDAASINTGITRRDEHLRSADFFDVVTVPTFTFRSTRVEPASLFRRDHWLVVGDLTMHGVTRSVELAAERTDGSQNPSDADVISFVATTKINRKDFGIGLDLPLEKGEFVIGDDVKIAIDVQALKSPTGGC
jgi:polyisoprenoid-binding protein YceI